MKIQGMRSGTTVSTTTRVRPVIHTDEYVVVDVKIITSSLVLGRDRHAREHPDM